MMIFSVEFRGIAVVVVMALTGMPALLLAQPYPTRAVRLIVPQAPGSASDTVARIIAAELSPLLRQQVVVDNRPGGALTIGIDMVVKAPADGYTLGYAPIGALVIGPNMMSKPPYDVGRDLQAVAQVAFNQMLLAGSPRQPFKTVQEVIEFAKQNPGKLSNASSGNGSPGHVGFELFRAMAGLNVVHVPYKGGAAAITDLIAGQVQLMMESLNSIAPHAKAGRVRALGVSGRMRSPAVPDVPTIAESGVPDYEATTWNGVVAPAGTPRNIVGRLNADINRILASPSLKDKFALIGADPTPGPPEEFANLIKRENVKWADVIKRSGAKID
ncbi:MAG TPA: tripartite tricarboxylate transporter substrate binding protein [Burkholderiales bacterium]|nr:tripartite tricarboxylate transporter substrate binding protein [Burkholderiales bacterium]